MTSVIHDIGYRHYDGPRLGRAYAVRSLYLHGLRAAYGLGRPAKAKIMPFFLFAIMLLPAAISVAVTALASQVGDGRPVQDERARAEVLAALEAVDLVAIFAEDTPIRLITQIKPSVLVKGGDYTRETVVGHEIVEAHGGEVVLVDILQGHSTTALVKRAREGRL